MSFENTVGKGKIAHNELFLLFTKCFLLVWRTFCSVQVFGKHGGKRRNCSLIAISPFPTVFSTYVEDFLSFSSNLKVMAANSFSLEESKFFVWETVKRDCLEKSCQSTLKVSKGLRNLKKHPLHFIL